MTHRCERPLAAHELYDYFTGGRREDDDDRIESQIFFCPSCSDDAERIGGMFTAVANNVPPVLSRTHFAELEARGRVEQVNVIRGGEAKKAYYPAPGSLLVHRFEGIDLSRAQRVDLDLRTPDGSDIAVFEDVPFDRERGEILVACQSHFAELFPRDLVFDVVSVEDDARTPLGRYTVEHQLRANTQS